MKVKFILFAITFFLYTSLSAQDGYLDTTFNTAGPMLGKRVIDFGRYEDARGMALDNQGRIILATSGSSDSVINVTRLTPEGVTDTTFGTGGVKRFGGMNLKGVNAVAIQPDGKILLAGYFSNASVNDMMVMRLYPNGSLDPSFDSDGIAIIDLGSPYERVNDMKLQSNGRIILVGTSNSQIIVFSLTSSGALYTAFNNGAGSYTSGTAYAENGTGLALNQDTIVVSGDFTNGGVHFRIVKLTPQGTQVWRQDFNGSNNSYAPGVVITSDLKIVVCGGPFEVARFHADGQLDTSFGDLYGSVIHSNGRATGIIKQDDGKLLLTGYEMYQGYIIMRVDSEGFVDSTFGTNGRLAIYGPAYSTYIYKSVVTPDKKLLVAGGENGDAGVLKVELRPVMHVVGNKFIAPQSLETYKIIVPSSWTAANYGYSWVYDGENEIFHLTSTGKEVTIFFTDSVTAGKLICSAYNGQGLLMSKTAIDITVNTNPTNSNQLADLECNPGIGDCSTSFIDYFKLHLISNLSTGCSENGYSDFTQSNVVDTLIAGGVYSISLIVKGGVGANYAAVWIDYNNDGAFNSTNEFAGQNFSDNSSFAIPNIILKNEVGYDGPKRLRVRARLNVPFSPKESCPYNAERSETEDYLVVLSAQKVLEGPEIITPNDDGKNDYFVIRGIDPHVDNKNKLTVFDRMGKVQFTATNYENNWNGLNSDGDKLSAGTYYYVFTKDEEDFIRGFLEIRY